MFALESNINGLWVAKQTAKGAPVTMTVGSKRLRWVGGDVQTNRADGNENWSDGTLFGDVVDFVNTLVGNGAPVAQGQSSIIAYLAWLAAGQETVTGGTNAVQTIPAGTATSGTFTLTYTIAAGPNQGAYVTSALPFNATAAAIATAVQGLAPIAAAGGTVTGGGGPVNTTPVTLTFSGGLAAQPIPLLTLQGGSLAGGTIGAPTSTTVGTPFQHVATPLDTGGFYSTWVKSVGKSTIHRNQFNDCRIQSLRLEASSASKVFKATPTFISLDPGQMLTADPSKVDDGLKPLIYTEGQGNFTIDGQVYTGHSAFAALFSWGLQEWYGDDVAPFDVVNQRATATLEGITIIIDAAGISRYNNQIYGTPSPAANAKPIKQTPFNGSYSALFSRVSPYTGLVSESCKVEFPGVKWSPDLNIPANPDGGAVELGLAGEFRKAAGQPPWRITTQNPDAAYTA
jgi:hypothetical protein